MIDTGRVIHNISGEVLSEEEHNVLKWTLHFVLPGLKPKFTDYFLAYGKVVSSLSYNRKNNDGKEQSWGDHTCRILKLNVHEFFKCVYGT